MTENLQIEPVTLQDDRVRLEPLSLQHEAEAMHAVQDGRLWELWCTFVPHPDSMGADIARRLQMQQAGSMLPFVVRELSGRFVGMTTYLNRDPVHHRVEIGATWYAQSAQGTGLNARCKYLLLQHAFAALACNAVELRTHYLNARSRAAIAKIGAQLDGILRNHMVMPDGSLRHTAVYSIIACEWPAVRSHLQHQIATAQAKPQARTHGSAV